MSNVLDCSKQLAQVDHIVLNEAVSHILLVVNQDVSDLQAFEWEPVRPNHFVIVGPREGCSIGWLFAANSITSLTV